MAKTRAAIPKATSDAVLGEFHHLCAVCGRIRPQLHHIDENPANNDPKNLIPLCPNHHLTDQHNPTRKLEVRRLQLFREYKDPAILSPAFQPLFSRFEFLLDGFNPDAAPMAATALIGFVSALNMGGYYGKELGRLIGPVEFKFACVTRTPEESQALTASAKTKHESEYERRVLAGSKQAISLCVELLRYQGWKPPVDNEPGRQ